MKDYQITEICPQPCFELEDFMNFSKETRLDSSTLKNLADLWENWLQRLKAVQIEANGNSWLVVWLPDSVSQEVDSAWNAEPGKGFLMNSLAQYLCMTVIDSLLPQTSISGCAPAPRPHASLRKALHELGLGSEDGILQSRFAVVTYYPFQGGCEVCGLAEDCPRKSSDESFSTMVLRGHEK